MYHDKFEESVNWTQDLLTSFSISCFVNNLNDEIKVEVRVFHLNSMTNLAGLGQLQMGNYKGFNIQVKYFNTLSQIILVASGGKTHPLNIVSMPIKRLAYFELNEKIYKNKIIYVSAMISPTY